MRMRMFSGLRGVALAKRIIGAVLVMVLLVMLLHATAIAVYLLDYYPGVVPWYAAYPVVALSYAVPVSALLALYLILWLISLLKNKKEGFPH